jgi:hypothetical protein
MPLSDIAYFTVLQWAGSCCDSSEGWHKVSIILVLERQVGIVPQSKEVASYIINVMRFAYDFIMHNVYRRMHACILS